MEFSNKNLAFFVVLSISLSFLSTLTLMNKLNNITQPQEIITGRATPDYGNVTLEIESSVSIILQVDTVDFGAGFVNDTNADCVNFGNLTAGNTYTDSYDCWTSLITPPPSPTHLVLENDGNVNVTVDVVGPTNASYFDPQGASPAYAGSNRYGIEWSINDSTNSCVTGAQTSFIDFNGTSKTVCTRLRYPTGNDRFGVNIRVFIPTDLGTGVYENSTIRFSAVQI